MRNMRAELPRGQEGSVFTASHSLLKHSCIVLKYALQDAGLEHLVGVDSSESVGLPNRA